MNPSRRTLPQRVNNQQRGFSMVELMIAITISLLLLAGVIQIFSASRQTYTLQDGMSRLQENARYALERHLAGYRPVRLYGLHGFCGSRHY